MNTYLIKYVNGYTDVVTTNASRNTFSVQLDISKSRINDLIYQESGESLTDILVSRLRELGYIIDFEPVIEEFNE